MVTMKNKETPIALHRKYLHKMDRIMLLMHLALKYSVKFCSFVPNMNETDAFRHNADMCINMYDFIKPVKEQRDIAEAALITLANGLPIGCKLDQMLLRFVRYLFFHNEG